MREDDGRMVPTFIRQALLGEPLSIYGECTQTRSVQYVEDLIEGVIRQEQGIGGGRGRVRRRRMQEEEKKPLTEKVKEVVGVK